MGQYILLHVTSSLEKARTKMLVLSGTSLFISLTETLPENITTLGLNLSGKEAIFGWFILAISTYLSIRFILLSSVEIVEYYLPDLILNKTSKTTGNTLGLTVEECFESQRNDDYDDTGTTSGELHEISKKNEAIQLNYKAKFVRLSNLTTLIFEVIGPIILSIISIILLYNFLTQLS